MYSDFVLYIQIYLEILLSGTESFEKSIPKKISTPYFNSPSIPSHRILEELDDNGNFIEDPKLRRPISISSDTTCPLERAKSTLNCSVSKDKQQEANPEV